jgi:diadenosine tetraphosphatase ApaH/serine/threonine PP2A family protein phosphatase
LNYLVINVQRSSLNLKSADFIEAMDKAITIMQLQRQQHTIVGGHVDEAMLDLLIPEELVLIGDVHGDLKTLFKILDAVCFEEFLTNANNKMIFLGDYVDRGNDSIGVLYTLCYLKQKYPDSVILMRGNHEAPVEFPFSSHDLPYRIVQRYGEYVGRIIYQKKVLKFFSLLTLGAVVENHLLLVHGGLPTKDIELISNFRKLIATAQDTHIHNSIMEEILWNDPWLHSSGKQEWTYSKRGYGRLFGPEISKKWLKMSETKVVVRGHQPCQGYKIDHEGMIMTLFSCKEPYPKFKAGYLLISASQLLSIRNGMELSKYIL